MNKEAIEDFLELLRTGKEIKECEKMACIMFEEVVDAVRRGIIPVEALEFSVSVRLARMFLDEPTKATAIKNHREILDGILSLIRGRQDTGVDLQVEEVDE